MINGYESNMPPSQHLPAWIGWYELREPHPLGHTGEGRFTPVTGRTISVICSGCRRVREYQSTEEIPDECPTMPSCWSVSMVKVMLNNPRFQDKRVVQ